MINHRDLGNYTFHLDQNTAVLFCDNETNLKRLYDTENKSDYTKDGINDYLIYKNNDAVNHNAIGTKAAANYDLTVKAGSYTTLRFRLEANNNKNAFDD